MILPVCRGLPGVGNGEFRAVVVYAVPIHVFGEGGEGERCLELRRVPRADTGFHLFLHQFFAVCLPIRVIREVNAEFGAESVQTFLHGCRITGVPVDNQDVMDTVPADAIGDIVKHFAEDLGAQRQRALVVHPVFRYANRQRCRDDNLRKQLFRR